MLTGRTQVAIVSILRRGARLGDRLNARLAQDYGLTDCARLDLQIKRYADDLTLLVDRGAAKLPVRTDIVGARLDVAPSDIIECNVPPYEDSFKIDLLQPV